MSTIPAGIGEQLERVRALCRRHHVARLELFGSAADGRFDIEDSDCDFLVDFALLSPTDRADAYFGLLADLQDLFQREVDLVEVEAIKNPYFRELVEASRTVVYAA